MVEEAVPEYMEVVVAFVPVAFTNVKFWRVVEPKTERPVVSNLPLSTPFVLKLKMFEPPLYIPVFVLLTKLYAGKDAVPALISIAPPVAFVK